MRSLPSRTLAATLAVVMAATIFTPSYSPVEADAPPPRTLITLADNANVATVAADIAAAFNVSLDDLTVIPELKAISLPENLERSKIPQLKDISTITDDPVVSIAAVTPTDPLYSQYQWGLPYVGVDEAWSRTTGSSDVVVAIIDTGVSDVAELTGAILPGYDFINDDADPSDDHGHGTMSATVVAARSNDDYGMAGVCWVCQIMPVKVLDADGTGAHSHIAAGIVWATDNGADIINLSLGGPADLDEAALLDAAVEYAVNADVLVLAAAGNNGLVEDFYPAASPGAVSIAGSTNTGTQYEWTNYGSETIDISAPGCNVAQGNDNAHYLYCGTSSATPFTAGVAALAMSANPSASASEIAAALKDTASSNTFTIHGNINAEKLLFASPATDPEPPTASFTYPFPGRYLSGEVTVSADGIDNVELDRAHLYVNGTYATTVSSPPWSASISTLDHQSGPAVLKWRLFDRAGNVGVVERTVYFDNTPPTVSFASPYPSQNVRGIVHVTPSVVDDAAVRRVKLYANGSPVASSWTAPYTIEWDSDTAPEGPVVLKWRVYDHTGKTSVVQRTVVVDRSSPTAAVQWPNPGRYVRGVIGVRPTVNDDQAVASTALFVNGSYVTSSPGSPSTLTWDTTAYSGRTELSIRVRDKAGNTTFSPIRVVYVENEPPSVAFAAPNPSALVSGTVTVRPTVSDNTEVLLVALYANESMVGVATSSPWEVDLDTSSYPPGPLVLKWAAFDVFGNRSIVSRTVIVE